MECLHWEERMFRLVLLGPGGFLDQLSSKVDIKSFYAGAQLIIRLVIAE